MQNYTRKWLKLWKPHYSMATVDAANSAEEAIEAFLFSPDYIMGGEKN